MLNKKIVFQIDDDIDVSTINLQSNYSFVSTFECIWSNDSICNDTLAYNQQQFGNNLIGFESFSLIYTALLFDNIYESSINISSLEIDTFIEHSIFITVYSDEKFNQSRIATIILQNPCNDHVINDTINDNFTVYIKIGLLSQDKILQNIIQESQFSIVDVAINGLYLCIGFNISRSNDGCLNMNGSSASITQLYDIINDRMFNIQYYEIMYNYSVYPKNNNNSVTFYQLSFDLITDLLLNLLFGLEMDIDHVEFAEICVTFNLNVLLEYSYLDFNSTEKVILFNRIVNKILPFDHIHYVKIDCAKKTTGNDKNNNDKNEQWQVIACTIITLLVIMICCAEVCLRGYSCFLQICHKYF